MSAIYACSIPMADNLARVFGYRLIFWLSVFFRVLIMKLSIYKLTKYILGILINIFNVFAKYKYELKWLPSFPKYFNTIIKPKKLILFSQTNFSKARLKIN